LISFKKKVGKLLNFCNFKNIWAKMFDKDIDLL
jgi:hypothetical protein